MSTTAYRTWVDRIDSGTFTHAQCRQWAAAVVPIALGEPAGGHRTNLTTDEAAELIGHLRRRGWVNLTDEHANKGVAWLRRGDNAAAVGLRPDWWDHFAGFRFDGEAECYRSTYRAQYHPVWTVLYDDGTTDRYSALPWQARAYG